MRASDATASEDAICFSVAMFGGAGAVAAVVGGSRTTTEAVEVNGGRSNPVTASALIRPATMLIAITTRWARVAVTRSRGRASGAVSSSTNELELIVRPNPRLLDREGNSDIDGRRPRENGRHQPTPRRRAGGVAKDGSVSVSPSLIPALASSVAGGS